VNYPENCLTPQKIEATADGKGTVLEWQLDDAITTSGMGIDLEKPVQPGAKVSLVLNNSPYALLLLIVSICLSMMVLGHKVNFLEISLLSAVYCLLFITMASLSDFALGFWGSLVLGNLLTLGLTWLLYRKYESVFLKRAILGLVVFFTLIYPLSGLLPELSDNFNGWVTIALIVYIFFISLYARTRKQSS
jgi:hypothetical protein